MTLAPNITNESYEELRARTLLPHETASLFESIAEISSTDTDEQEEFENSEGEAVNAFASPMSLWEMKTGRFKSTPPATRSLWSRMKWGVIDSACDHNDIETRRPAGHYLDGSIGLLSARPDVEVSDDGANWYPMIAKNIASTMADMWRNGVGEQTPPEHMIIEANHHMAVTGAERFYIAALFGGVSEKLFIIERDEELIVEIFGAAEDFWKCVTDDRRPNSSSPRDAAVIARINAKIDPDLPVIDLTNNKEFIKALEEKESLGKEKSKIERRIKELTAYLNSRMDGCASAIISDTRQIKWIRTEESEVSFIRKANAYLRTSKITDKAAGTPLKQLVS